MNWIHTYVTRNTQNLCLIYANHDPLSSSQDHPRRIFPEQLQLQKSEPVWTISPTSKVNF